MSMLNHKVAGTSLVFSGLIFMFTLIEVVLSSGGINQLNERELV
ncbi:MAG: hypothetical protein WBA84_06435 [Carnobacterium sp.]